MHEHETPNQSIKHNINRHILTENIAPMNRRRGLQQANAAGGCGAGGVRKGDEGARAVGFGVGVDHIGLRQDTDF